MYLQEAFKAYQRVVDVGGKLFLRGQKVVATGLDRRYHAHVKDHRDELQALLDPEVPRVDRELLGRSSSWQASILTGLEVYEGLALIDREMWAVLVEEDVDAGVGAVTAERWAYVVTLQWGLSTVPGLWTSEEVANTADNWNDDELAQYELIRVHGLRALGHADDTEDMTARARAATYAVLTVEANNWR